MTDETTVQPDETPAAPVPVGRPAPPTQAPASAIKPVPPRTPRGRRAAGTAGQVAGIAGIVVCLLLAVGVVLGRGWLIGKVDTVAASIDAGVARAVPLVATATSTLTDVADRVGQAGDAAASVATNSNATPSALQGVADKLSAVSQRYLELRGTYADARATIVSALDRLALVDRLVPGISIPPGPVDALASLDAKVQALDAQIMGLIEAGGAVAAIDKTAQAIADSAHQVEATLTDVAVRLADVETRLRDLQAQIESMNSTAATAITLLTVVVVLLLLWLTFLHYVLFRSSRGYSRAAVSA